MRALLLLAVVSLLIPSATRAETLAEAAAREAARRQQGAAKKAPVYTAGELNRPIGAGTYNPMTGPAETTPRSRKSAPPGLVLPLLVAGAEGSSADRRGGGTEAQWRQKAAVLRGHITAATQEVSALEKIPVDMTKRKLVCANGNPQCWNPQTDNSSPEWRLSQARQRLAALQQAFTAFEDEARKQSVPPGWLR
jgi:hypothetical protein